MMNVKLLSFEKSLCTRKSYRPAPFMHDNLHSDRSHFGIRKERPSAKARIIPLHNLDL